MQPLVLLLATSYTHQLMHVSHVKAGVLLQVVRPRHFGMSRAVCICTTCKCASAPFAAGCRRLERLGCGRAIISSTAAARVLGEASITGIPPHPPAPFPIPPPHASHID